MSPARAGHEGDICTRRVGQPKTFEPQDRRSGTDGSRGPTGAVVARDGNPSWLELLHMRHRSVEQTLSQGTRIAAGSGDRGCPCPGALASGSSL